MLDSYKYKNTINSYLILLVKILLVVLPITYLYGFILFIDKLPKYKPYHNIINNNIDAIVVLTGGQLRISEGLNMLQNKHAELLFISGLFTELSIKNYRTILSNFKKIKYDKIHYDTIAKTTIENAEQVKYWVNKNNVHSVYLITSYYHIPRAEYLIKKYIPNLKVITHPVFPSKFDGKYNIYDIRIFSLIFFEYNKLILSGLFIFIKSIL